jgi:hypothetical protein
MTTTAYLFCLRLYLCGAFTQDLVGPKVLSSFLLEPAQNLEIRKTKIA